MTIFVTGDDAIDFLDPSKYDILFWFLVGMHAIICLCDRCGGDNFPLSFFLLLVLLSQGSGQGLIEVLASKSVRNVP